MKEENIFALFYLLTIVLFLFWCFRQACDVTNDFSIPNYDLNQIQMFNDRRLIGVDSDQQHCPIPLNVLNDLEYENIYNLPHTRPRQPHDAAQTSRIDIFSTPQATTVVPLSSSLNYAELNTPNVVQLSRAPPPDDLPPSYDECMASSFPTSPYIHSYRR